MNDKAALQESTTPFSPILAERRAERDALNAAIAELEAAERIWMKHASTSRSITSPPEVFGQARPALPLDATLPDAGDDDQDGASISYLDAALIVREIKGAAITTSDVADWMIEHGHKRQEKRKFIKNTIYNQLKQSTTFRLVSPGLWDLA